MRKILLIHTILVVLVMRVAMKIWSLRKILLFLQRRATAGVSPGRYGIDDIRGALATAGRYLPATTCLINGLAGQYLLGRNGYTAKLHIGVKKETEALLSAHAWVSVDEQVVIGQIDDLHTYTTLPDIC